MTDTLGLVSYLPRTTDASALAST